jgi:hypothetical protein
VGHPERPSRSESASIIGVVAGHTRGGAHLRSPSSAGRSRKRAVWWTAVATALTTLAAVTVAILLPHSAGEPTSDPPSNDGGAAGNSFRAFEADSWWNTLLPASAPLDPNGDAVLNYLRTAPESGSGCLSLAGTGDSPWGQPVYWARNTDQSYDLHGVANNRPPELDSLRIPQIAQRADTGDGNMTIFDRSRGYVTLLTDAQYDQSNDSWSASGATVTYLDSNGLHVGTGFSDNPNNTGSHRGNNGATSVVRYDMVQAGAITNVLKISSGPEVAERWVFPMIGSDGHYAGSDADVPPQGLRLRLKPTLDLNDFGLAPQALVIAKAIQQYGVYIGDSGGTTALKLEDTEAEGSGRLWHLAPDSLCVLNFIPAYWDVIAEGYDPSNER